MHSDTPAVIFLGSIGAGLVLQSKAGVIRAVVAGSGGAGTTGSDRHRAGAWKSRGLALRPEPPRLVYHLHCFKHPPWVIPVR